MNELEASESLGVFLDEVWLPAKQGGVEVATYDQYAWAVRCHVKPLLGALPLGDLSVELLDKWVDALIVPDDAGKPRLGRTSARTVRKILSMALDDAVQRGLLVENQLEHIRPPTPAPRPARQQLGWTVDEAGRFLAAASTHRLAALFHLGLVTGLRRGELLALRWLDVNVEECYLYVRQQLAIERNRPVLKPVGPEHGAGRIVTFGPAAADALARHRAAQALERDRAGDAWIDSGLVFTTRVGGWVDPSNLGRLMDGLIDTAGVPRIPPKGMRHTADRAGREVGNDRLVEERLGRAEPDDAEAFATLSPPHRLLGERLDEAFAPAV